MKLIEDLNWRYATKKYSNQTVSDENVALILESIRLTATSLGLQPFKIFQIDQPELRAQLKSAAYNQSQLVDASHVLVFAVWTQVTEEMINDYLNLIATTRGTSLDALQGFKKSISGFIGNKDQSDIIKWASNQAYIALGKAMTMAATLRVDSTPMEGFDPAKVNEILDLPSQHLHAAVILTLGYRDAENDPLANAQKVRRPIHQIFEKI
jgi:nitroreductase / dihydropteridine reductase